GNPASTAEVLMRSRYSAYVLGLDTYLLQTWHPDTRPTLLDLDSDVQRWLGLEVKQHQDHADGTAIVEFVARYKTGSGKAERLHETSRFIKVGQTWFYLDALEIRGNSIISLTISACHANTHA